VKKLMIGFMLMAASGSTGLAQADFYTNVTNLWYQGGESRSNVITIANARLAANTNDFAGLLLKAHYHIEFAEVDMISNAFLRVVQVGDTIATPNFVERWQGKSEEIPLFLEMLAEEPLTPQEIQEQKNIALIPHTPLPYADLIEALHKDGYFDWGASSHTFVINAPPASSARRRCQPQAGR
jgi:hypothetical protein